MGCYQVCLRIDPNVWAAGIKGMWSLHNSLADEFDRFLVITFVGDTRILAINAEDELEEAELPGFDTDVQVCC